MLNTKTIYLVIQWEGKFIHSAQSDKKTAESIAKDIEESMGWKMEVKEVLMSDKKEVNIKKEKTLFDAFTKGFNDGMATIISVFNISSEDVKNRLHSIGLVTIRISELYHLWMGF